MYLEIKATQDAVSQTDQYEYSLFQNRHHINKNIKVFTCIAQNSPRHEKVFQTFNVSILYPPEEPTITGYDDNFELKEGDHQSFTCSALAGNPPAELRWYRGDTELVRFTMAMRKKGRSLNPAELETVINEICADDVSDNDIMIPELDELEENVVNTENSDSDTEKKYCSVCAIYFNNKHYIRRTDEKCYCACNCSFHG
ncbi:synaptogenesis protein syg-2 [Trichonephila clavata]|uniref:Synaptogenesis protein syg-2 n=1 Tax=Trichonephila clavata TaxID=2740835 RepID=A0A8X6M0V7_TRICU|nr:synaptogenesis protein syg-2 [Trichonephila clavata]